MQLNKLFQLSMDEVLGLSRQQVSKFVDRASFRAVRELVGKSELFDGGRPGRVMLRDWHKMIVIGDHTIAVEEG